MCLCEYSAVDVSVNTYVHWESLSSLCMLPVKSLCCNFHCLAFTGTWVAIAWHFCDQTCSLASLLCEVSSCTTITSPTYHRMSSLKCLQLDVCELTHIFVLIMVLKPAPVLSVQFTSAQSLRLGDCTYTTTSGVQGVMSRVCSYGRNQL